MKSESEKSIKQKKHALSRSSLCMCNTLLTYTIKYYVRIVKAKFLERLPLI